MEQNIETKDVQRTEYLDKNGLDMLWAKVKENTHNQVEVERNRAVAKENSITNSLSEFVSKTTTDAQSLKSELSVSNSLHIIDGSNTDSHITIICDGISNADNNANHVYATDGSIADLTQYLKIDDAYQGCIPYYNKYTEREIQRYQLADKEGIELSSYGTRTELLGTDIAISSGSEDLKLTRSGIYINSYGGESNHFYLDVNSQPRLGLYDNKCAISAKIYGNTQNAIIGIRKHNYGGDNTYDLELSADGIEMMSKTTKDIVTANKSTAHIGLDDDQTEYTYVAPLENGKVPTKYLTAATKESLGVVKVGDGINVTDGTISIDQEYLVDMMSYGVEWDTTVADPACTRIGNMSYHKSLPIQSQYKGCLVKNGKVNYYLDPNDWSKKADGTPSVLDGTDGDVMVHIPKFYGKSGSNGNKRWVRIATKKIDSSWVEIPEMFVSAYRITTYTDSNTSKVASVVNTTENYRGGSNRSSNDKYLDTDKFRTDLGKPRTNVSRSTMRTNANNSGQELLCYEYYKWVFYWAYVIEYANFNSQKEFNSELTSDGCHQGGLGSGLTNWNSSDWSKYNNNNPITPCGYTNEFGNFSGVKQILIPQTQIDDSTTVNEKTLYANRWRGFENPFGDIWTNLDGIVLKRDSANAESKVYTTYDSSKFGDDTSVMNVAGVEVATDGYTKEFDLRETGEIIPQLVGRSESTYKCDYNWCNSQYTDKRTLLVGGLSYYSGLAGLGCFNSFDGVGIARSDVGFRSVVLAAIPEVDTSDFVSKTTTDNQSIKSGLNVYNNLNIVDGNNESLIDLSIHNTPYDTHTNSSIAVKSFFDGIVDGQQTYQKGGCMIEMVAGDQRNPYILISTGTEDSYTGEKEMKITKSGIIQKSHMYDEDTNYYFAANGTVNDIYNTDNKDIYRRFDDIDTSVDNEGIFVSSWNNLTEETEGVRIKNSGISITNGSQNEVFATDGSIADLTQYVLKSIYDEKITALESRIAALEANHTTE